MAKSDATGQTAALSLRSLDVTLAQRPVLRSIDLEVATGEICALIGPNGAGKTTLMRAACGLLRPTSGTVRVLNQDPSRSSAARARIGLVPQQIALYDHLSVRENLFVLGRLSGLPRSVLPERAAEAMDRTHLSDRADDRVAMLSGGYQRRANIACALLHRPTLLVLDEPTVAVDQEALSGVLDLIGRLRDDGIAILVSTHELDRAEQLADRVAILVDGRLVTVGRPSALIAQHYGTGREITVKLATAATPELSALMSRAGLAITASDLVWRGLIDHADQRGNEGLQALENHETIEEFRSRRPGLDTLYAALCGRDARS